ncbi:condensation domain-containing protein [Streptomyces sp. NBC_01294]|uniref:condensation domain-containing protein n=1 Tax=Streptomyces sp. NBC_01294 TaxID=2903815 RepID=UPI002DDBCB3E|nr:condensation domain-containing protein [Streptomyces sp. NBC_01294]WRZ55240.1 condensation domain-containing protein [Streptomyces sp. NBC_01294]WRZ61456.1 condensation domain-containing protein [Streptomyces sp. NBC_01294]
MSTDTDSAARDRKEQLQQELLRRARAGTARRTTAGPTAGASAAAEGHAPQDTAHPGATSAPAGSVPLSRAQRRMWLMERLGGAGDSYHVPFATRVRGPFDAAAFATALTRLVARHAILRTRYAEHEGEPCQEVLPTPRTVPVHVVDTDVADAPALLRREAVRPFDLAAGDAVRAFVLRHGPQDHTLLLTFHHIAVDAASLETVATELAVLYTAATDGTGRHTLAAPPQYADHARREHDGLPGFEAELNRCSDLLADAAPPRLPQPAAAAPQTAVRPGAVCSVPLAPAVPDALRALGAQRQATLFAVSLAAAFAALHRLTGDDDLVIGVAGTHRSGTAMRGLVGLCVNTLPVRVDVSGDPSFAELLRRVSDALLEAQRHRHIPFDLVLERLGAGARGADGTALVRVTSDVLGEPTVLRLPGTSAEYVDVPSDGAKFTLSYGLVPGGDAAQPLALVQYDANALDDTVAEAAVRDYAALLHAVAADPQLALSKLPLPGPNDSSGPRDAADPEGDGHPAAQALRTHPGVADATVVQPEQGPPVAYAVLRDSVGPSGHELLGLLRRSLAPEAVPAAVTVLDALPRSAAGPLDHARLPGPSTPDAPSGPRAEAVRETFAAVLGVAPSPDDDFFALGGHSLKAVQLAERLRTHLGLPLTGLDVLQARTPRALTALLDEREARQSAAKAASRPAPRSRDIRPGTVLVTGATGGVGAFVVRELAAQGRPVLALARPESAHLIATEGVDVIEGDLSDLAGLRDAVAQADAVVHAACTFTRHDVDRAAMETMVDAWRRGPFVFVSSVDAYGHPGTERVAEESAPREPVSPYGRAKLDCEAMVLRAAGTEGRGGASAVRSPIVWGAHDRLREQLRWGAIGTLYQSARQGRPIDLPRPGTGGHRWYGAAWVHAAALARAVAESLDRPVHGVANACSGHVSWHDLAQDLTELLGTRADFRTTEAVPQDLDHRWHYDSARLARPLRARAGEDRRTVLAEMIGAMTPDKA